LSRMMGDRRKCLW